MKRGYIQLSDPIPVSTVVEALMSGEKTISIIGLEGSALNINISSVRIRTYTKGTSCVNCGKEAHFFIAERDNKDYSAGHLNLYHRREDGSLVMMTSDHIIPKSRGGDKTGLENRQPMCCYCNFRKGNLLPGETHFKKVKKVRNKNNPFGSVAALERLLTLHEQLPVGMPLQDFYRVRAELMHKVLKFEHLLPVESKTLFRNSGFV